MPFYNRNIRQDNYFMMYMGYRTFSFIYLLTFYPILIVYKIWQRKMENVEKHTKSCHYLSKKCTKYQNVLQNIELWKQKSKCLHVRMFVIVQYHLHLGMLSTPRRPLGCWSKSLEYNIYNINMSLKYYSWIKFKNNTCI